MCGGVVGIGANIFGTKFFFSNSLEWKVLKENPNSTFSLL